MTRTHQVLNKLANLTNQARSIAFVTKAVACPKQIEVDACGEIPDLKNTVNGMGMVIRSSSCH